MAKQVHATEEMLSQHMLGFNKPEESHSILACLMNLVPESLRKDLVNREKKTMSALQ